jgi:tetratricopeptide (TPR) repeat protein
MTWDFLTRSLAGVLLAIALASSQTQPQPVRQPAQPATSARLAQQPASGTSYVDIVTQYRAGAFENAVTALESLSDAHEPVFVMRQLESAHPEAGITHPTLLPMAKRMVSLELSPVLPAAAVLHLEAGDDLLRKEDAERGIGHLMAARNIVDSEWWTTVPTMLPDREAHYDKVRHDIYLGIIFALQHNHQFGTLLPHLERAREQFPKDADIRLALGTLNELRASAIMLREIDLPNNQNPSASWRREKRREYLDKAVDHFRDALNIDNTLSEARVRLGRVLQERGKLPEARRELEAAVAASAPEVVHYFGSLFLGEVLEAQRDAAGAIARYQETVKRWPDCQSAHLALSRAFEMTGNRQAARGALQPLWRAEAERKCLDPWWLYYDGQSWRTPGLVEDLRGRVKDTPQG